jgi:hypothetical protein
MEFHASGLIQSRRMERRVLQSRTEIQQRMKADLRARLEGVCSHLDPADFDRLLDRMVWIELKYAVRGNAMAVSHEDRSY